MFFFQKMKLILAYINALGMIKKDEKRRGTLEANRNTLKRLEFPEDMSWAELLGEKAAQYPDNTFIQYVVDGRSCTYDEMNRHANRVANYLKRLGARKGEGVAMIMDNSPEFLMVFFAIQKLGMYAVTVNTSLRGDSLFYILDHSEASYVVVDEEYREAYERTAPRLNRIKEVLINTEDHRDMRSLAEARGMPDDRPDVEHDRDDPCLIIYTSGTTGLPKGVVYRYRKTGVKTLSAMAYMLLRKDDVLYTPLSLFHGNALFLTTTMAMHLGLPVVLSRKFSASRFWNEIRDHSVTTFNTIGAMIPILMKQPEKETDRDHKVRFTISAACPADLWEKFEKRFNVRIYEGYGAIDGGGKSINNIGTAPVGSIGKPAPNVVYRLVDENMNDVPVGTPGELIFEAGKKAGSVEYFKNEKATNEKVRDGWIFTGDLVREDRNGYLYFVGRNTESMRIKGENVSAYEVEQAVIKHPAVLEAAVYAVPSELAEDEIMASVSLVNGRDLDEGELLVFLRDNLPRFAVPRYVKIVEEFQKTETQRIIKKAIQEQGIVPGTYDSKTGSRI